jgi:oligosaccharide reducing-end xylanase
MTLPPARLMIALAIILSLLLTACQQRSPAAPKSAQATVRGAYASGNYPNYFAELLGKTPSATQAKLDAAFQQLFYGDDATQRVYYPVGADMAYIADIGNGDVRSEGISYGMMIAVQLDKQAEFNRLWQWAKRYMYHVQAPYQGYFAWHCTFDGKQIDGNPAPDGEIWFATALFFAAGRWGNGHGIFNYRAEAQSILDAMLRPRTGSIDTPMFNPTNKLVVFVPHLSANGYTDPSYHLPAYFALWARWADKQNDFWQAAATASRNFLQASVHPQTGLMPDYANFDGTPYNNAEHNYFRFDAWRTAANIAVDHTWFAVDPWQVTQSNRLLDFFAAQGIDRYANQFALDGTPRATDHSPGLVAMNAVAALAATTPNRTAFVQALWDQAIPSGQWRYYDGLLHLIGLLHVSGNFRIYEPM